MRLRKILLDGSEENEFINYTRGKITPQNAATYLQFFNFFCLSKLYGSAVKYVQRWFTVVAETDNFLNLEYSLVKRVLSSSNLHTTSEFEVFDAANAWLGHYYKERSGHAKELLLTVRLNLFSCHGLNHCALQKTSWFIKDEECLDILNEIVKNKENYFKYVPNRCSVSRYCNQNDFKILHSRENDLTYNWVTVSLSFVEEIDGTNLQNVRDVPLLTKDHNFTHNCPPMVYLNGHVYLLSCLDDKDNSVKKIKKYSIASNALETLGDMLDDFYDSCVCGFINKIYFVGGSTLKGEVTCCFDTVDCAWKYAAGTNHYRSNAACTVFEGKVVVSGGQHYNYTDLSSVEAFDHVADEWSFMPSMIESASRHELVAVKNKLFAVGSWKRFVEVYDSTSGIFAAVKQPGTTNFNGTARVDKVFSVGRVVFITFESNVALCYDVDKEEYFEEACFEAMGQLHFYTKVPNLKF